MGSEEGFDADAIELGKRGRDIAQNGVGVSPAEAFSQWRSFVRLERRRFGDGG